jgi:Rrf2 family protein
MVISTKGRYALRLMIDLAQHCDEGFISLKTVSQRQDVSLKYMEAIAAALNRANLVISQPASDITVAEVLHSTEGSMAAVSCLDAGENGCERAAQCLTLPMWKKLDAVMDNYLSGVSVQDLLDGKA